MKGIKGNIQGIIQKYSLSENDLGETVQSWVEVATLRGWLDLSSGSSDYETFNSKFQDSTHIFIADYVDLSAVNADDSENLRMIVNGKRYDIKLIDNPMELETGSQLEIYLKYTGGQ